MLNENVLKKIIQWITFADEDLQFAQHGLTITKKPPCRLIAFHAQQLSAFAISSRYPGEDEEVTRDEAVQAIFIATSVRNTVRNTLMKEGLSL